MFWACSRSGWRCRPLRKWPVLRTFRNEEYRRIRLTRRRSRSPGCRMSSAGKVRRHTGWGHRRRTFRCCCTDRTRACVHSRRQWCRSWHSPRRTSSACTRIGSAFHWRRTDWAACTRRSPASRRIRRQPFHTPLRASRTFSACNRIDWALRRRRTFGARSTSRSSTSRRSRRESRRSSCLAWRRWSACTHTDWRYRPLRTRSAPGTFRSR
jgi:hypothetical protein